MIWHLYFLIKAALAWKHLASPDVGLNLLLAAWVYWPVSATHGRVLRTFLSVVAALALLSYESMVPNWSQWQTLGLNMLAFSWAYWIELLERFVLSPMALLLALVLAATVALSKLTRAEPWVLLALVLTGTAAPQLGDNESTTTRDQVALQEEDPDQSLLSFWKTQAALQLPNPLLQRSPFNGDIAVLHICSLAWDDMEVASKESLSFFERFDVVFDQFNSVSSYSGPSMLRLMRSRCGQAPHDQLYTDANPACQLFPELSRQGFQVEVILNHNGRFDQFSGSLGREIGARVQTADAFPHLRRSVRAFDGSDLVDDADLLSTWWQQHTTSSKPRALYYNSITLHDGNQLKTSGPAQRTSDYAQRLQKLMTAVDHLMQQAAQSERGLLLVFVPEHGAALHTRGMGIAGLRHSPLPSITHVPVAVSYLQASRQPVSPLRAHVSGATSYLDLTRLVESSIAAPSPLQAMRNFAPPPSALQWVGDNGDVLVVKGRHQLWSRQSNEVWKPLRSDRTSSVNR